MLSPGATERQDSIIIRPISKTLTFIQLDDLDAAGLKQGRGGHFSHAADSPRNHQAWIAVSGIARKEEAKDFARRLRKGAGADPAASGATRVAGTVNYKRKSEPDFPTVQILEAHPGPIVTKEQLQARGLVTAAETESVAGGLSLKPRPTGPSQYRSRTAGKWPDYAMSPGGAPPNRDNTGPDRSMADFSLCMTAIDWGWTIEETAVKLLEVSERADQRNRLGDEDHALIRAQNAAATVERNDTNRRGRG